MTRGRKPLQPNINTIDVDEALIRNDLAQIDQLPVLEAGIEQNALALAKELAYDGALTVESLEEEIKFYQRRSVEAVLEMGKRLLLLKEVAGHGAFSVRLDGLGIGYELAKKFMAATRKFQNGSRLPITGLPGLNQGKLLELLVLDDGEIEALNSGEAIRGITLDDVDCMSVSELRRALRKEKADKEAEVSKAKSEVSGQLAAKDKLLADRAKRIAELVEEKNKRECLTEEERLFDLERQLTDAASEAVKYLHPLRRAVHQIRALDTSPLGLNMALENALNRVIAEVNGIAVDYGIALNLMPEWVGEEGVADEAGGDWLTAEPTDAVIAAA